MARQLPRIYLDTSLDGAQVRPDAGACHYIGHVLRLATGSEIIVFNGQGTERIASIESLSRRDPLLTLGESLAPLPESPANITLLQGLVKSDRMDTVVQKTTELGVRRILAVRMEFSVVKLDPARATRRLEHWNRVAHSACEQSGRHFPPGIDICQSLDEALNVPPPETAAIALHDDGAEKIDALAPGANGIALIVGPEGGFSPAEIEMLNQRGCPMATLGPRILRAETAAIVACSAAQLLWGDLG